MKKTDNILNKLKELILEGEKDPSVDLLITAASQYGFETIVSDVLQPVLVEYGELWMKGKLSLAHGYLCGKIAEEVFSHPELVRQLRKNTPKSKGTIVIGNIEDDFHPLGRRLVSTFAKSEGWHMIDLGNDVTARTFVNTALAENAQIIAASAMMFTTAKNIRSLRKEIDARGLTQKIRLAVGGAVFQLNPDLVEEVGGDGTAPNALKAPQLFDSLIRELS